MIAGKLFCDDFCVPRWQVGVFAEVGKPPTHHKTVFFGAFPVEPLRLRDEKRQDFPDTGGTELGREVMDWALGEVPAPLMVKIMASCELSIIYINIINL